MPSPLGGPARPLDRQALLFGRDETPGIVSVLADRSGHARVWRRVGGQVHYEEDAYLNWLLLSRVDVLGNLPLAEITPSAVSARPPLPAGSVGLVRLDGDNPFRYLVLTDHLDEVEGRVLEAVRRGIDAGAVTGPISEVVYVRPPVEQYLTITGRTYYKDMTYDDVRRLQFDLETTGLGSEQDRIFMVAIKDSHGFGATLDVETMDEGELILELARIIRERDPDVIENHNIFDFDIKFLLKRAQALAIPLPIARDGTGFVEARDSVRIGATNHSFTRYSLAGREIVDTLHATRRFSAIQRDLRSNGLKEAARYLGVASEDREYVDGADIWRTFQEDPARLRRYCWDDVEEVDRISRILLGPSFALASMVPRPYERIATAGTGQGLIEPLLVRAYLTAGQSLPTAGSGGTIAGAMTAVFTTGVVHNVVKADVASLYPSVMLAEGIGPATDFLGAFPGLLEELTALRLDHKDRASGLRARSIRESDAGRLAYHDAMQAAMKVLINSFYGMLAADFSLFCDKTAAERVTSRGREILQLLLTDLQRRGALLVEADTDGVLFGMPPRAGAPLGTREEEAAFVAEVAQAMPGGIRLEHDGRYRAMYSYMEKNYALLAYDEAGEHRGQRQDPIRLVGVAFRSQRTEPFIERFLASALRLLLEGDIPGIRGLYRSECRRLWAREVPMAELCVTMPLTKTPQAYAQAERKEEAYEVYLAAGYASWPTGHRVQYYQTRTGKRLLQQTPADYDPEFYIGRLRQTCLQRFDKAFTSEDLHVLFSEQDGLFDPPLESIRPLRETRAEPLPGAEEEAFGEPLLPGWD